MNKKISKLILLIVIMSILASGFGYWYYKVYQPKKEVLKFIQQNLKEKWRPQILPKAKNIKGKLYYQWEKEKNQIQLEIHPSSTQKELFINFYIPHLITLTPDIAKKLISPYFTFPVSLNSISCFTKRKGIAYCRSQQKEDLFVVSFDRPQQKTLISLQLVK